MKSAYLGILALLMIGPVCEAATRITICNASDDSVYPSNNTLWFQAVGNNITTGTGGVAIGGGTVFAPLATTVFYGFTLIAGDATTPNACTAAANAGGYLTYASTTIGASLNTVYLVLVSGTNQAEALAVGSRIDRCFIGLKTGAYTVVDFEQNVNELACY